MVNSGLFPSEFMTTIFHFLGCELQQCLNKSYCLPEKPKVAYGLRGSSTDIYVDNVA